MKYAIFVGKLFFALAFVGLGVEHFLFEDFVSGRAPAWPDGVPGKLIWAYTTGTLIALAGLAILSNKRAREAAVLIAALILAWALLRHIPVVAMDPLQTANWTPAGKALTFFGGALAMAAVSPPLHVGNVNVMRLVNSRHAFMLTARICLGIFLIVTGILHFIYTEFVASLIPSWFPGDAVFWTYFAAIALLSGGLGLLIPQTAGLAALLSGVMVFSWFWIVHIPRTFASVSDGIAVFEALAVSGIGLVIAGFLYKQRQHQADARGRQSEAA